METSLGWIEDLTPFRALKNLRIAIDRCLDLLRRAMKPVMPVFREFFPSISPRAVSPP